MTVFRDEEVLGLEVAVDDSLLVRGGEAFGDLEGVVDDLPRRRPDPSRACRAASCLRGAPSRECGGSRREKTRGFLRMNEERRRSGGLVRRAVRASRPNRCLPLFILLRNLPAVPSEQHPPQPHVPRPVNLPHPARAERREDLVWAEPGAGRQGHLVARSLSDGHGPRRPEPAGHSSVQSQRRTRRAYSDTRFLPLRLCSPDTGFSSGDEEEVAFPCPPRATRSSPAAGVSRAGNRC